MPTPVPNGYHPRRLPGESCEAAIERCEYELNFPDPDDAPRGWEP